MPLFILLLIVTFSFPLRAQDTSRTQDTKKKNLQQISQPLTSNTEASAWLNQAIECEASGNTAQAIKTYRFIAKKYILTREAPEAQFLLGKLFQQKKNLQRAFDTYQALIMRYPEAKQFDEAIAEQINIANYFLETRSSNLVNILMSNAETAQHMYEKILASSPFGRYAPMVQYNLGLAHERQGHAQNAVQAYQALIDKYPNSNIVNNAQYQIAYVYMRIGLNKNSQDLSALWQAQDYFQDYSLQHPNNERELQIQKNVKSIGVRESLDIYNIAKFYDRNRSFKAASIYYNNVILRQPFSPEALLAKTRLETLRSEFGDDILRTGPDKAETGKTASMRRRSQASIETQALSDYAGPSKKDIIPDELPVVKPKMRTGEHDIQPLNAPDQSFP